MRWITGTKFAKGRQGNYFVDVRTGERLPCIHKEHWKAGRLYHQKHYYDPSKPKAAEYIEALKRGRVVVTTSEMLQTAPTNARVTSRVASSTSRTWSTTRSTASPCDFAALSRPEG
jgi:hypothetical protein